MKPKSIGIVGGAGPLAGAALLDRILCLSSSRCGCYKDADFPKIWLLSFPFSEMLTPGMDAAQVRQELSQCLCQLRQNGAAVLAIACNTLHAFLDEQADLTDLVHLPRAIATAIQPIELPLVLCTSTSRQFGLHQHFFACTYPDADTQEQVDQLIEQILKGTAQQSIKQELLKIIEAQSASIIILGCTELSLFTKYLVPCHKTIIDPLEIVAHQVVERSFNEPSNVKVY
jgi:aspartate racemase